MKIFDAADNEVVVQSVAKHMESIPLESLGGAGIDPANLPFPLPHGTKQFDGTGVACAVGRAGECFLFFVFSILSHPGAHPLFLPLCLLSLVVGRVLCHSQVAKRSSSRSSAAAS